MERCPWPTDDPLYITYHDEEWGRPVTDDIRLFEKICLEGFQSGLSWITILRKRENFRAAFDGFDPQKVAHYDDDKVEALLRDAGIVRHQGKIRAAINNAAKVLEIQKEFGSFASFVWQYEPNSSERPATLDWATLVSMTTTPSAVQLSKDLKKRGFKFVGPTTCYAFMQAMGMVNDHIETCFCRARVEQERAALVRP